MVAPPASGGHLPGLCFAGVLSVYPIMGRGPQQLDPFKAQLAMAVVGKNRHRHLLKVRRRHWNETAHACGISAGAEPWIQELLEKVEPVIQQVEASLPTGDSKNFWPFLKKTNLADTGDKAVNLVPSETAISSPIIFWPVLFWAEKLNPDVSPKTSNPINE